jgi:hypothetical protein
MPTCTLSPRCLKMLNSGLEVISALVKYKTTNCSYTVTVGNDLSWDDSLTTVTILNKDNKEVYKNVSDGNRVAILVNLLWMNGNVMTIQGPNNSKLFYIPKMDMFISASSKRAVWREKDNPQRIDMVTKAQREPTYLGRHF